MKRHFEHLFVFGRPAGGKSEFIDFMKHCEPDKRLNKFHIAPFQTVDDYRFITELADHEDILEELKQPVNRITQRTSDGVGVNEVFWRYAPRRMNQVLAQKYLKRQEFYNDNTLLIEFSRGKGDAGYKATLSALSNEILERGAIINIKVSFEESLRRNEARYQEKLKHSILAHKCPDSIMQKYYKDNDWDELTHGATSGTFTINGVKIPFVTMNNEPESKDAAVLEARYGRALNELWSIYGR